MALATPAKNFLHQDQFAIEIDGFKVAEFTECSELSLEISKVEAWEGGSKVPNKSPGKVKFTDLTLKRFVTGDSDFLAWVQVTSQLSASGLGASAVGLADGAYKRNFDIVLNDRDGTEKARWSVVGAWPTKHVAFDKLDGKSDEALMEELTLTYDYYDRIL